MPTMEAVVAGYLTLRTRKKEIEGRLERELQPVLESMAGCEAWMLRELDAMGAKNVRTEKGTVYKSRRTSVTVENWPVLFEFIDTHDLWHMLAHAVAKTAVEEYVEANGALPPGLKMTEEATVNVRTS